MELGRKTTFIRMLAGVLKPENSVELPELHVSYKPQKISPKFQVFKFLLFYLIYFLRGSVRQLLHTKIKDTIFILNS